MGFGTCTLRKSCRQFHFKDLAKLGSRHNLLVKKSMFQCVLAVLKVLLRNEEHYLSVLLVQLVYHYLSNSLSLTYNLQLPEERQRITMIYFLFLQLGK